MGEYSAGHSQPEPAAATIDRIRANVSACCALLACPEQFLTAAEPTLRTAIEDLHSLCAAIAAGHLRKATVPGSDLGELHRAVLRMSVLMKCWADFYTGWMGQAASIQTGYRPDGSPSGARQESRVVFQV